MSQGSITSRYRHRHQLGHEGNRLLVHLRSGLQQADDQPHHQRHAQHRSPEHERYAHSLTAQIDGFLRIHSQ